jgi:steroid 5-alpha reductase family enzyme
MLERRADKKWRDDPEYQRYKETTSSLIPMFKRKNKEKK